MGTTIYNVYLVRWFRGSTYDCVCLIDQTCDRRKDGKLNERLVFVKTDFSSIALKRISSGVAVQGCSGNSWSTLFCVYLSLCHRGLYDLVKAVFGCCSISLFWLIASGF